MVLTFLKRIFCCIRTNVPYQKHVNTFDEPNESNNDSNNDSNKIDIHYNLFENTNNSNKSNQPIILNINIDEQINKLFINQDYLQLSQISIGDVYNYVNNNLSIDDFINWKLKNIFLIQYHNALLLTLKQTKQYTYINLQYLENCISKLITLFLFFETDYNINEYISFLKNKKHLFNSELWLDLLINPIYEQYNGYHTDNTKLQLTTCLAKNIIIPLYQPIQYFNLNHNMFEYIILGKMYPLPTLSPTTNSNEPMLYFCRFFDLDSIKEFVSQVYSGIFINQKLVNELTNIILNNDLEKVYVDSVIKLLVNKNNLYQIL
jgi:hypothetical protein